MAKRKKAKANPTPKGRQLLFAAEYLVSRNASEAYRRAYPKNKNPDVDGPALLGKPGIQAWLKHRIEALTEKCLVRAEDVVEGFKRIAFSNMRDYVEWGQSGVRLKDSGEISEAASYAVAEVSETVTESGGTTKFKLCDKQVALHALGEYLKLFEGKSLPGGTTILVVDPYSKAGGVR